MPKVPKEDLKKEGVRAEVAPARSVKKLFSLAHEKATRAIVSVALAAALASCSPSASQAQDTTPAKGKPVAAAVEKKGVTYETIADLSELQPYLDAAKDKLFTIKKGETKQIGPYKIRVDRDLSDEYFTHYGITTEDGKYDTITIPSLNENINKILLDMGDSHPYIKGPMLVFADNQEVRFMFFDKKTNEYRKAIVPLGEGGMPPGPVQTGYGMDKGGLFVITAPRRIAAGDVINQAAILNDGSLGPAWFKFEPKEPSQVAMLK